MSDKTNKQTVLSNVRVPMSKLSEIAGQRIDNVRRSMRRVHYFIYTHPDASPLTVLNCEEEAILRASDVQVSGKDVPHYMAVRWLTWLIASDASRREAHQAALNKLLEQFPVEYKKPIVVQTKDRPTRQDKEPQTLPAIPEVDGPDDGYVTMGTAAQMLRVSVKHLRKVTNANGMTQSAAENPVLTLPQLCKLSLVVPTSRQLRLHLFAKLMDMLQRALEATKAHRGFVLPHWDNPAAAARAWADMYDKAASMRDALVHKSETLAAVETQNLQLVTTVQAREAELETARRAIASAHNQQRPMQADTSREASELCVQDLVYKSSVLRSHGFVTRADMARLLPQATFLQCVREVVDKMRASGDLPAGFKENAKYLITDFLIYTFYVQHLRSDGRPVLRKHFSDEALSFARRVEVPTASVVGVISSYGTAEPSYRWCIWFRPHATKHMVLKNLPELVEAWVKSGFAVHAKSRSVVGCSAD